MSAGGVEDSAVGMLTIITKTFTFNEHLYYHVFQTCEIFKCLKMERTINKIVKDDVRQATSFNCPNLIRCTLYTSNRILYKLYYQQTISRGIFKR